METIEELHFLVEPRDQQPVDTRERENKERL